MSFFNRVMFSDRSGDLSKNNNNNNNYYSYNNSCSVSIIFRRLRGDASNTAVVRVRTTFSPCLLRAHVCVSTVIYVPIAGNHVTCQGSRVLSQVSFSFFLFFRRVRPSTDHGASAQPDTWLRQARISSSALRNQHLGDNGRADGCVAVEKRSFCLEKHFDPASD